MARWVTLSVSPGQGGCWFAAPVNYDAGASTTSVAVVDVNADGSPDLVTANRDSHDVSVLRTLCLP